MDLCKALISLGADVDTVDGSGQTALVHAVEKREEGAAIYLLEEAGADWQPPSASASHNNVVRAAVAYRLLGVLQALMRRMHKDGLDHAQIIDHTFAAAQFAIEQGRTTSLKVLVEEARETTGPALLNKVDGPSTVRSCTRYATAATSRRRPSSWSTARTRCCWTGGV